MSFNNHREAEKQNVALKRWIKNNIHLKSRDKNKIVAQITELKAYGLPIKQACALLGINPSTYYRRIKKVTDSTQTLLIEFIRQFQIQHRYAYGAKRMAKEMSKRFNQAINHKRIARLMKLNGLNATIRKKSRSLLVNLT